MQSCVPSQARTECFISIIPSFFFLVDSPDEVTGQGPLAEVTQGVCAGLPRPGRRIRCLHFGQEKTPDGNVPTHGHARRRWNGAVLFAENPRRPGTTNGGGSFPSRLSGAEPSPSAPFFRRRGAATAGVGGHFQVAGSAPRACCHPLFSHASARIPVTISNLSPPILRPRPRSLPTRAATQRFTLLISRLLVN